MSNEVTERLEATTYDRSACDIGIIHLGYGAFHRAHQAVYIDDAIEATKDLRWGIAAVNLRAAESKAFAEAASAKDGYVLKTVSPRGEERFRLVRPHIHFSDWSNDTEEAEALLSRNSVHAVTITVTESGYYLDDQGNLNTQDPIIAEEAAGGPPRSVYAYLARAIRARAETIDQSISILCCDNIRSNGKMLAKNFKAYLELIGDSQVAAWVSEKATFPCSMVDRITPRPAPEFLAEIGSLFEGRATGAIQAEDFIQWALQDNFAGPMADLASAGVLVVDDVDPYEETKIRILNGGHTGLAYLGALAGHSTFDEAMEDPDLRTHFDGWQDNDVLPGLTLDLPMDKVAYRHKIAERFENTTIADSLERICMDGFSKFPIFVKPTLESRLANGADPIFGYDCIASWYVFAKRVAQGNAPLRYQEPNWDVLEPLLADGEETSFAENRRLWADLPTTYDTFVPGVLAAIKRMEKKWQM